MQQYLKLNGNKLWGVSISFLSFFILFSITNKAGYIPNMLLSAGIVLFIFGLLFIDAYLTFKRKDEIFSWPFFQGLIQNGFWEELTAYGSKFLFTDKRLSGYVEDYLVRIDGTRKMLAILIGIDYDAIPQQSRQGIIEKLKSNSVFVDEILVEKS